MAVYRGVLASVFPQLHTYAMANTAPAPVWALCTFLTEAFPLYDSVTRKELSLAVDVAVFTDLFHQDSVAGF